MPWGYLEKWLLLTIESAVAWNSMQGHAIVCSGSSMPKYAVPQVCNSTQWPMVRLRKVEASFAISDCSKAWLQWNVHREQYHQLCKTPQTKTHCNRVGAELQSKLCAKNTYSTASYGIATLLHSLWPAVIGSQLRVERVIRVASNHDYSLHVLCTFR